MLRAWDRHLAHPAAAHAGRGAASRLLHGGPCRGTRFRRHRARLYGGMALRTVENYLAGQDDIDREEAKARAEEQRELGARGEYYFAVLQFCFIATRPG